MCPRAAQPPELLPSQKNLITVTHPCWASLFCRPLEPERPSRCLPHGWTPPWTGGMNGCSEAAPCWQVRDGFLWLCWFLPQDFSTHPELQAPKGLPHAAISGSTGLPVQESPGPGAAPTWAPPIVPQVGMLGRESPFSSARHEASATKAGNSLPGIFCKHSGPVSHIPRGLGAPPSHLSLGHFCPFQGPSVMDKRMDTGCQGLLF